MQPGINAIRLGGSCQKQDERHRFEGFIRYFLRSSSTRNAGCGLSNKRCQMSCDNHHLGHGSANRLCLCEWILGVLWGRGGMIHQILYTLIGHTQRWLRALKQEVSDVLRRSSLGPSIELRVHR